MTTSFVKGLIEEKFESVLGSVVINTPKDITRILYNGDYLIKEITYKLMPSETSPTPSAKNILDAIDCTLLKGKEYFIYYTRKPSTFALYNAIQDDLTFPKYIQKLCLIGGVLHNEVVVLANASEGDFINKLHNAIGHADVLVYDNSDMTFLAMLYKQRIKV